MRQASTRKRASWRKRFHRFLSLSSVESVATFRFHPEHQKQDDYNLLLSTSPQTVRKVLTRNAAYSDISLSQTGALVSVLFVCLLLLGAESTFEVHTFVSSSCSRHSSFTRSGINQPPTFTALESHLHEHHAIPVRYIRLLSHAHQTVFLSLLSTPPSITHLPPFTRRAVFTHITDCSLPQCLRAMASSIAYSQTTGRVAVIFADVVKGRSLEDVVRHGNGGVLSNDAMVVALELEDVPKMNPGISNLSDWAEFSVLEAVVPGRLVGNTSTSRRISHSSRNQKVDSVRYSASVPDLPVIGNTKTVATLDNLAVTDVHVSLSLSEVVWSKYSPRTVQEYILSSGLEVASDHPLDTVSGASILGRRIETRDADTAEEILHGKFEVPVLLLRGMSPIAKQLLLLKLMSKRRKGVRRPRAFFVHAQYGLGNRLRALGSAMAFARKTDRVLVLIWVPDQHLNCKYTDLFVSNDEFVISDGFVDDEEWPFRKYSLKDPKMKMVKWYNYMRTHGTPPNSALDHVTDDASHHIYVSTCYVIQSPVTPLIIRTQSSYWQVLRTLTPHIDVMRLIERFASYPMSSMIGVHIRGKSIKADIDGISSADYSEESSRRTDYWRNLTQVDTFIAEMKRQPPDRLFYVAADQRKVFLRLEREFPSRVFYTPRKCDGRNKECLPFALADILLLARCASLRGSYWSSFSELSVRIGGGRFLLAGIDFGRP